MHLSHLRLRDFRNYARLDLDFGPGFQLLLGNNAQGKTSVLEAIYLLATLRSFRGTASGGMVRQGQEGYFVQGRVGGPLPLSLGLYWSNQERRVLCDGEPARTLSAFLEGLRAVVFSSEDLEMVRGPARIRRRFLDLLQVHSRPADLSLLQRYARTLRSRNALLRQPDVPPSVLEGFDHELVRAGQQIMESRRQLVPRISELAAQACEGIAGQGESLALEYRPSVKEDFARELIQSRDRESRQGSTVVGPPPRQPAPPARRTGHLPLRERGTEALGGHRPEDGPGHLAGPDHRRGAGAAPGRCHGGAGPVPPLGAGGAAAVGATGGRAGVHDLHRAELEASGGRASGPVVGGGRDHPSPGRPGLISPLFRCQSQSPAVACFRPEIPAVGRWNVKRHPLPRVPPPC